MVYILKIHFLNLNVFPLVKLSVFSITTLCINVAQFCDQIYSKQINVLGRYYCLVHTNLFTLSVTDHFQYVVHEAVSPYA